jgi:hypothetical protein
MLGKNKATASSNKSSQSEQTCGSGKTGIQPNIYRFSKLGGIALVFFSISQCEALLLPLQLALSCLFGIYVLSSSLKARVQKVVTNVKLLRVGSAR